MDDFSAILSAGILPRLGEEAGLEGGIKKWLVTGNFVPESVDGKIFSLNRVSALAYANAISQDYERFALSSLESYIVATSEYREFNSASWPLLKLYYSSFFAAHAIMRARGSGIINLEKAQSDHINAILTAYNSSSPQVSTGTYMLQYLPTSDIGSGEISVQISPAPTSKGVHEAFWRMFAQYLVDEAKRAIEEQSPDGSDFLTLATNLKDAVLQGESESSWLSMVRNRINYQHGYETWMPFRKSSEAKIVASIAANLKVASPSLDINKSKKPLEAFLNISCYLANLNIGISRRISQRSTKGNTFGQKWRRLNLQLKISE